MASDALTAARTTIAQAVPLVATDYAQRRADFSSSPNAASRRSARVVLDTSAGVRTALTNARARLEEMT